MARGLSPLQQQILRLAWEKEQAEEAEARAKGLAVWPRSPLYHHEIFLRRTDWPLTVTGRVRVDTGRCAHERGLYFAYSEIDPHRYKAAHVALCRSLGRLHARGLITFDRWQSGVHLMDQGRQTAQQLMVSNYG
jgi:hypothetical protein